MLDLDVLLLAAILLVMVLARTWMAEDGDDMIFARVMQFPAATNEGYLALSNHILLLRLATPNPFAGQLPLFTRVGLYLLSLTDVGAGNPLEILPAAISLLEMAAVTLGFFCLKPSWYRNVAIGAAGLALATSQPAQSPVLSLVLIAMMSVAAAVAHGSLFLYLFGGLAMIVAILSNALFLPLILSWLLAGRHVQVPALIGSVYLLASWQICEAVGRMASPSADLVPERPLRLMNLLYEAAALVGDTSLLGSSPHYGNSWLMYQLLFTRFHHGTRFSTAIFSLIPPALIAVNVAGEPAQVDDTPLEIAAVTTLCVGLFGPWLHPCHALLAFALAPRLCLRIKLGFFVAGSLVVVTPLMMSYRYAWLELGTMPQPNFPFYGGTFFAFTVAVFIVQLSSRLVTEARVRCNIAAVDAAKASVGAMGEAAR
jgi:hypothetical protein